MKAAALNIILKAWLRQALTTCNLFLYMVLHLAIMYVNETDLPAFGFWDKIGKWGLYL